MSSGASVTAGAGSGSGEVAGAGSEVVVPKLDKASFTQKRVIAALRVPAKQTGSTLKKLRGHMLAIRFVKCVVVDPEDKGKRLLLLNENTSVDEEGKVQGLSSKAEALVAQAIEDGAEVTRHELETGYKHMTADKVLERLLPKGVTIPSAYETVGHLAHMNLRDDTLPYRYLVGEVILDKHKTLKTVVNKVGSIHTKFRTFEMEVIAGEPLFDVKLNESGAKFQFNFKEVYWNSRLQMEHKYVVDQLAASRPVVADMFCGVGPFAVPLAMAGCVVHANDLNPRSYHFLKINAENNNVTDNMECYNLDAREFIQQMAAERVPFTHVLMNLPADALEFTDAFIGLYSGREAEWEGKQLPFVYCYCFSKAATLEECKVDVRERLGVAMDTTVAEADAEVRLVRDVAPRKTMLCAQFHIPRDVAFRSKGEPPHKRQRVE